MDSVLHILGAAKGAVLGAGSDCAVCGASPFAEAKPAKKVFGPSFTDYDLISGQSDTVCAGCALVLGGKPSRENPPLRMMHYAVVDGELSYPDADGMVALLSDPPPGLQVISWTSTRQRHTSLRCGPCTPPLLEIGTEKGPVRWDARRDARLLRAVADLRDHAKREHIVTGQYPPHTILAMGAAWEGCEAIVAEYRPSLALDMAIHIVRRRETAQEVREMPELQTHRRAAQILLGISSGSAARQRDPIAYWATLLQRRVAGAADRPDLTSAVGHLMETLQVQPTGYDVRDAIADVESMTSEEQDEILSLLRTQPRLVIAVARMIREEQH